MYSGLESLARSVPFLTKVPGTIAVSTIYPPRGAVTEAMPCGGTSISPVQVTFADVAGVDEAKEELEKLAEKLDK